EPGAGQLLALVERRVGQVVPAAHRDDGRGEAGLGGLVDDHVAAGLDDRAADDVELGEVEVGPRLQGRVPGRDVGEVGLPVLVGQQGEQLAPAGPVEG